MTMTMEPGKLLLLILAVLLLNGCSPDSAAPKAEQNTTSSAQAEGETALLLEYLQKAGLEVRLEGEITQPFFLAKGRVITVNRGAIQVFEYDNEQAAQEDAKNVAPDGGSVGTSLLSWADPPRFYYMGSLIVLFVGTDQEVLATLEEAMGPPFAGTMQNR